MITQSYQAKRQEVEPTPALKRRAIQISPFQEILRLYSATTTPAPAAGQ
jgi:hypothetical protein